MRIDNIKFYFWLVLFVGIKATEFQPTDRTFSECVEHLKIVGHEHDQANEYCKNTDLQHYVYFEVTTNPNYDEERRPIDRLQAEKEIVSAWRKYSGLE